MGIINEPPINCPTFHTISTLETMTYIEEAKEALSGIFSKQHRGLWMVCFPIQAMAPSHSLKLLSEVAAGKVSLLKDSLDKLRREVLEAPNVHNDRGFVLTLNFELTGGIVGEAKRWASEAEVRVQLLDPLLKRMAYSAQCIAVEGYTGDVFSSALSIEVNTEEPERPGRRPQVDYLMSAHAGETLLYCIPVEAKSTMPKKHVTQLSVYQATVSTRDRVGLGLLVDKDKVRFSFSFFA